MEERRKKTGKKAQKIIVLTLIILTSLLLLAMLAGMIGVGYFLGKIERIPDDIETIPPGSDLFETDLPFTTPEPVTGTGPEESTPDATGPDPVTAEPTGEPGPVTSDGPAPVTSDDPAPVTAGEPVTEPEATDPPVTNYVEPGSMGFLGNVSPSDIKWSSAPELNDGKLFKILIVGQDAGEPGFRTRTDAMILLTVNGTTGQITMTSFLRDMYVQIPGGYRPNRLNVPYIYGGLPLLYSTLLENFGVHVDGAVVVDFAAFKYIIELVGGVDIYLTQAEVDNIREEYTWEKKVGINHLDGDEALAYARIRVIDSDFGRTSRQRTVVTALYDKIKGKSFSELVSLVNSVLPYVKTDMSNSEIISAVTKYYRFVGNPIEMHSIPVDGAFSYAYVEGMAVILPNFEKNRAALSRYLGLN